MHKENQYYRNGEYGVEESPSSWPFAVAFM